MIDLKNLTYDGLNEFVVNLGEPKYRAKQIYKWLYRGVTSFDEMTDVSKPLRTKLADCSFVSKMEIRTKLVSKLDGTVKYLFALEDGNCVESVVMRYKHGLSICVSSQVGCRMGCRFCASTIGGLVRNLTAGEILNQIIFAEKDLGERIGNVVVMGIGEGLDNYDNLMTFLHNANHEDGLGIGYRHISVSTCGLVPRIRDLAKENLPITLCISLHAPNNEIRNELMPVNKKYDIETLFDACREYLAITNRRITFEYSLINGVNDTLDCAKELVSRLQGMLCHVNLIPVNEVKERSFVKSNKKSIEVFGAYLEAHGINATVRRTLGSDINASCGQLRREYEGDNIQVEKISKE